MKDNPTHMFPVMIEENEASCSKLYYYEQNDEE
jgi:hypothetical protein